LIPQNNRGSATLEIGIKELHKVDPENPNGPLIHDYTIRHFPGKSIKTKTAICDLNTDLVVNIGTMGGKTLPIQIALVDSDGVSFGKIIEISDYKTAIRIPLSSLEMLPTVLMPRPYPTFLPYFFSHNMKHELDPTKIEGIQISLGRGLEQKDFSSTHGLKIQSIWLQ